MNIEYFGRSWLHRSVWSIVNLQFDIQFDLQWNFLCSIYSNFSEFKKPDWPKVLKKTSDDIRSNFPIPISKFKFWSKTIASDLRRSWKGDDNRTTVPSWFPTISHRTIQQLGHWLNVMNIWYVQTITWPNLIMGLERPFETEFSSFVILRHTQAVYHFDRILKK